jgi:hypothetical protein
MIDRPRIGVNARPEAAREAGRAERAASGRAEIRAGAGPRGGTANRDRPKQWRGVAARAIRSSRLPVNA